MYKKMNSRFLAVIAGFLAATLLQGCGLFGSRGTASEKDNRRGEVTGVPKEPDGSKLFLMTWCL